MSGANYKQMNDKELLYYVKGHPQDEEAFQYFLAKRRAKPGWVYCRTEAQFAAELEKRVARQDRERKM